MPAPEIRALVGAGELDAAESVFRTAMVGLPSGGPGSVVDQREPGRTFGAFTEDGLLVGATDATSGTMAVPGGAHVPHAAVTHVGVLPTHTRRGILTALMRHQLEDCRERGETVASLRASEAVIYGRYGYGIAGVSRSVELDLRRARLHPGLDGAASDDAVRLVPAAESWELRRRIVAAHPATRPGAISRSDHWWAGRSARPLAQPAYLAVYGPPGAESAYISYRPADTATWFTSRERTVVVDDLHAPAPEAHRAIMAFLLRLDLVHLVRFPWLAEDDPLPWMLTDHRAARVTGVADETWLRLVDVPAALAARAYGAAAPVRIAVHDPLLPENSGVYAVGSDGAGRDDGAPDVAVDAADLASAYLGGTRWHQLAAAGRVTVHRPDALARLDALFASARAPFAGVMF